ncbi:protein phosphatase 2C 4-like [Tripterygium wilfordii]|uniref:protein-serine/threonine phosphatase n=1 Tax=Tripterygium wilfordii TaxID=458696 RepID=A0A7J7DX54_TRIWF|nr:probable protein phosphatase 2C 4 [Tripterygium wilfordii]KAF5750945.1 protein phosphatase 2C 4-like [Tripterygium wilfordii]
MGNGVTKVGYCFAGAGDISRRHDIAVILTNPFHEGLGHSFCYFPPDQSCSKIHSHEDTTLFRSISGASVSANASTPLSTSAALTADTYPYSSSTFESSGTFASIPLQPVPRRSFHAGSGPLSGGLGSGLIERGFLSGPIERGLNSGPIDRGLNSGPIGKSSDKLHRSSSHGGFESTEIKEKPKKHSLIRSFKRVISKTISRGRRSIVAPIRSFKESILDKNDKNPSSGNNLSGQESFNSGDGDDENGLFSMKSQNLQWAQGKAGEDRVQIVISEQHGWVFVGIYDGFNGPDAPDYLLTNLYPAVHKELKGLLWNESADNESNDHPLQNEDLNNLSSNSERKRRKNSDKKRCRCEWDIERKLKDFEGKGEVTHSDVLNALSDALRKTEEGFLEKADKMVLENPELALMGSCVLVMLMKGRDVYLLNVGDSRAVLARKSCENNQDLERISEESDCDFEDEFDGFFNLSCDQLTMDHSTYVQEEVDRIKREHPDDDSAVFNDRVKGYLKVTRAFGAGFLKQPKWNDALLEMFRIDYIGTSPYLTCSPSVYHHRLSPGDRFLILSSDGLYQYFTNEQAVAECESFISGFPEGDPAQHLIQEVMFRAAKKAGMDFHELLDIPQGDRRRYHDDVSVIIISLEGRIWRSSV